MALRGIDVSVHNRQINWTAVKSTGKVDFAILRAGFGNSVSQKDKRFEYNYSEASAIGIPLGAYWYNYAKTSDDAKREAEACIMCIAGKSFLYPVFYDVEEDTVLSLGKKRVSEIIRTFCGMLAKAGVHVGIYMSASPMSTLVEADLLNTYPIWVANVGVSKPSYNGAYDMWQYSWTGSILGINGDVDLDYCYVDYRTDQRIPDTVQTPNYISVNTPDDVSPYVVLPDETVKEPDFQAAKENKVVAAVIKVGALFDSGHNMYSTYKYPYLENQVRAASKAGLYYGLMADMAARSVDEAKQEISYLKIYVEKFAPPLGLWLALDFAMPKAINDVILEYYITELSKLGLTNKLGIYVTREQLSKITWENFKDRLYLWLIEHVADTSVLDNLLTPEFFKV